MHTFSRSISPDVLNPGTNFSNSAVFSETSAYIDKITRHLISEAPSLHSHCSETNNPQVSLAVHLCCSGLRTNEPLNWMSWNLIAKSSNKLNQNAIILLKPERVQVGFNSRTSILLWLYRELQSLNIYRSENCFENMWRRKKHIISTRDSLQSGRFARRLERTELVPQKFLLFF